MTKLKSFLTTTPTTNLFDRNKTSKFTKFD